MTDINNCEDPNNKENMQNQELNKEEYTEFYDKAVKYWSEIPPTVEGMLGGFGFLSPGDIDGSHNFLEKVINFKTKREKIRALDCGAGIGRITKHLLIQLFDKVDLVEQNPIFLNEAKKYIGPCNKLGEFYPIGLQDFIPKPETYDLIWCQWVLGHLEDDDFIRFFRRCISGLKDDGIIVIKENVTSSDVIEVDTQDSSFTRPLKRLRKLLASAGLHTIKEVQETNLPKGLFPVYMIALKPCK